MKNKFLIVISIMTVMGFAKVMAQTNSAIPAAAKVPIMEFDRKIVDNAVNYEDEKLPTTFRVNNLSIVLGRTTLADATQHLKTGIPLYDGQGYYQCYSIPRYSHQLWLVTEGQDFSAPITEFVVMKGNILPTEVCPVITVSTYPMFSNKIRLELPENLVKTVLGKPLLQQGSSAVYLYQLSNLSKIKVQTHIGNKGLDQIKITQSTVVSSK